MGTHFLQKLLLSKHRQQNLLERQNKDTNVEGDCAVKDRFST
jgi:hypothetical protein